MVGFYRALWSDKKVEEGKEGKDMGSGKEKEIEKNKEEKKGSPLYHAF
jgi:hypothetical protein